MRYKIFTNESFDKYIYRLSSRKRFEDRWDSLDLDDITADIDIPSRSEVNTAVRELDLVDDVAIKTGANDIKVDGNGLIRLLDFDDTGNSQQIKIDDTTNALEIDFDDIGADIKKSKSNIGAIGALDYDDDVDVSGIAASIEDVYTALASDDVEVVKSIVKRYAADIKDAERIKEILLSHAIKLNLECLKVMCGDMDVVLSAKEKQLNFIDKNDINEALNRFKKIAKSLTGANNTYGLIPNAIASCTPDNQIACMNIVDFLTTACDLPIIPIYFRGAVIKKCYDLAVFLYEELPDGFLNEELLIGPKGLLTRTKGQLLPSKILGLLANEIIVNNNLSSRVIGDILILCIRSKDNIIFNLIKNYFDFDSRKGKRAINYVDVNDPEAYEELVNKLDL